MRQILPSPLLCLLLGAGLLAAGPSSGQTPADFQRAAERFHVLYNARQGDSLFALYSPVMQSALPPEKNNQLIAQLHGQLGLLQSLELVSRQAGFAAYKAAFEKGVLTMRLALDSGGRISGFHFVPWQADGPAAATGGDGTTISLKTATGALYGSLVLPAGHATLPVVLIIAGSGPTDRDGNSPMLGLHSDLYKLLADSLALHGIASLRYDKRGVGASMGAMRSEADLTFEDYIADAVGFINLLRADKRFSRVIVLGHSEGSLVGMVAAQRANVDGYISASGAGDRIDKVIYLQFAAQSLATADKAKVLFDSLSKGYRVQEPADDGLKAIFRTSIQPYMISWLRYDPRAEIGKLHIPVLIIQGATDLQTTVADAEKLKAARSDAELRVIPEMNHIFRKAGTDRHQNLATYAMPSLPLVPEAVADITGFVLTLH